MCLHFSKALWLTLLLSFICAVVSAQDIIVKTDASIIRAVINEIDDNTILYHQWDNQTGPAFRIRIDQVSRIQFQNGTEQVFSNLKTDVDRSPRRSEEVRPYGKLEYIGRGDFALGGRKINWMDEEKYEELFSPNGYYHTFLSANKQRRVGNTLLPIGCGVCALGVLITAIEMSTSTTDISSLFSTTLLVSTAMIAVGGTLVSIAIPLKIIGNSRLRWIADDYNKNQGYTACFTVGPTANGFGIALSF